MKKLQELLKYIELKFPFNTIVYHKEFYLNKMKEKEGLYISICTSNKDPYIIIYNNGILTDTLYIKDGKIKIEQELLTLDDKIILPNIDYILDVTKQILDKYTHNEIMLICFSDFYNLEDLEDDIKYKKRDLENIKREFNQIKEHIRINKDTQKRMKNIENLLFDI